MLFPANIPVRNNAGTPGLLALWRRPGLPMNGYRRSMFADVWWFVVARLCIQRVGICRLCYLCVFFIPGWSTGELCDTRHTIAAGYLANDPQMRYDCTQTKGVSGYPRLREVRCFSCQPFLSISG